MNSLSDVNIRSLEGKRVAVAFSGGRDSVCLLHLLHSRGADVFAVNVEHGIRGETSIADSAFARAFCEERGIGCVCESVDSLSYAEEHGLTVEQAARELRYSVFRGLLDRGECDVVALAHHRDDQAETVLMRILRGTGIRGLKGMSEVSGSYVRPLLGVPRERIDAYIAQHSLPYAEDETNADERYTRNYLRTLISQIKTRYPAFDESIARLARNAAEADAFIASFVPVPEVSDGEVRADISVIKGEAVIAKRYIVECCRKAGVEQDIEERHFGYVFRLADAENGRRIELPHGLTAHKDAAHIVFTAHAPNVSCIDSEGVPFDAEGMLIDGFIAERVDRDELFKKDGLYLDGAKLPAGTVVRTRREGDFIEKFGGGTKSLGDFFTDKKVALRYRDRIPLLACGREIFAVFGVEISRKVKVDGDVALPIRIYKETR